jgi:predicted NAD-dependent protein-ADP-ribosyltransferase YbiA (DUF1768 family)
MADSGSNRQHLMQLQTKSKEEIDKYFEDQAHFYLAKRKIETIDNFNGVFDFLNNEYPCEVYFEGLMFPSVFHAFQAARSTKEHERAKIAYADSMQELYELATEIEDPADWQSKRLLVMEKCLRDKFRRHREMRERLRKTGNRDLLNSYADKSSSNLYWGVVEGNGQNHLGKLLEAIRLDVHTDKELFKWLALNLGPEEDKFLIPRVKVDIFKENNLIGVENMGKRPYWIFGTMKECDVVLAHQTISRRHLCLLVDKSNRVLLIDLGSKAGTYVNGKKIPENVPIEVKKGDSFGVGESTRTYSLDIDFSDVQEYLDKKHRNLQLDIKIIELQKGMTNKEELVKAGTGMLKQDTIFVSSLPDVISEKELREHFEQFGKVAEVRIPIHHQTGNTKNIAFIKYQNEKDAMKAFKAVRIPIKDKLAKIRFAEKNKGQILNDLEKEQKRGERRSAYGEKDREKLRRDQEDREKRPKRHRSRSRSRDKKRKDSKDRKKKQSSRRRSRSSSKPGSPPPQEKSKPRDKVQLRVTDSISSSSDLSD